MKIQNIVEGTIDKNELNKIITNYLRETLDLNDKAKITLSFDIAEEYMEGDWRAEHATISVFKKIHFKVEK